MAQARSDEIWDYRWRQMRIFVVRGDLDAHLAVDLNPHLERAIAEEAVEVLVDLEEATFMDAAALGILVAALSRRDRMVGNCVWWHPVLR